MKKLIPILLLSFSVAACYEEIIIPTEDKDPVVVMNAQMDNLEEVHTIYLSISKLSEVLPLPGASVKVFVNGTQAEEATEVVEEDPWNRTAYVFSTGFKPGDEVRIEARKDAFFVTSTAIVPPAVPVEAIDTASVRITYMGDTSDYLQLKVRFKDLPGRSWYGVDGYYLDKWEYFDEDGNVIPEYTTYERPWTAGMETDFDPVISEGSGKTAGGEIAALISVSNYYHCFSDDPIVDQECTLRILLNPYAFYLSEYRYGGYYGFTPWSGDADFETLMSLSCRVQRTCLFRMRSLDFTQYRYLKALNNLETFGTEVSFLVEPTIIPSNVEGGLGFVGIETVTEVPYARMEREYEPMDTIYY